MRQVQSSQGQQQKHNSQVGGWSSEEERTDDMTDIVDI